MKCLTEHFLYAQDYLSLLAKIRKCLNANWSSSESDVIDLLFIVLFQIFTDCYFSSVGNFGTFESQPRAL